MNKFEVGDRVRCVNASRANGKLVEGEIYTILRSYWIFVVVDRGSDIPWHPDRFVKVEVPATAPATKSEKRGWFATPEQRWFKLAEHHKERLQQKWVCPFPEDNLDSLDVPFEWRDIPTVVGQ